MSTVVSEDDLAILLKAGLSQEDIRHSILVAEKALDIAGRTGKDLDMVLIARGALFHDLGKALTHSYQHGEIGAEMGKRFGLPKAITDIAREHFHGGITAKEAEQRFEEIITNYRGYGKDTLTSDRYLGYHREISRLIDESGK